MLHFSGGPHFDPGGSQFCPIIWLRLWVLAAPVITVTFNRLRPSKATTIIVTWGSTTTSTYHERHCAQRPTMLFQRVARTSVLRAASMAASRRLPVIQQRTLFPDYFNSATKKILDEKYPDDTVLTDAEDPHLNGGYVNPAPIPRQFRDPYGDWWDKQERRNFGEPVHEDNDMLGIFSPYEYTWVDSRTAFAQIGAFIAVFVGVCWLVGRVYPDKPSFPREFEGGLERELGGPGAVRARAPGDPEPFQTKTQ